MEKLPFRNTAEAEKNVSALYRAFQFYSLLDASDVTRAPTMPTLHGIRAMVAKVLGFDDWACLTTSIASEGPVHYYDWENYRTKIYSELALRLSSFLSHEDKERRIYAALALADFGCSPEPRMHADAQLGLFPCETVEQWWEICHIEAGFSKLNRYRGSVPEDVYLWRAWEKDVALAKVVGRFPPPKPRGLKRPRL